MTDKITFDLAVFLNDLVETSKMFIYQAPSAAEPHRMIIQLPAFINDEVIRRLYFDCSRIRIGEQLLPDDEFKEFDVDGLEKKLAIAVNATIACRHGHGNYIQLMDWVKMTQGVCQYAGTELNIDRTMIINKLDILNI